MSASTKTKPAANSPESHAEDTVPDLQPSHDEHRRMEKVQGPSSTPQPRRSLGGILFWSAQLAAMLAVGYWLAGLRADKDHRLELSPELTKFTADDGSAVPITVAPVSVQKIERAVEAVGNLHGFEELTIKTKVSGRVAKIHHDFADHVTPGELLLEIDPTDAQLAVEQARRSLNSELAKWGFADVPRPDTDLTALPTVVSAKLRSEWTKSQYQRLLTLQNRGSATAEELEQAKTNAAVGESDFANQLLMARAGAATAMLKKADLDIAEQQLRETKIFVPRVEDSKAPSLRYTITDRYATEGAYLPIGTDIFRLVIDETLKLRLSIPEKYAPVIQVGQKTIVSTLTSDVTVEGRVARVGPAVDPQTRTFQIEVEVPNGDGRLKSGGFAKARVIIRDADDAVTVPTAALVTFAGIHKVFTTKEDKAVEVRVKLGEQTQDWVEIIDTSLTAGTPVVVTGQSRLAEGTAVRMRTLEDDKPKNGKQSSTSTSKADDKSSAAESEAGR
ncbi:MAG: efflux RND transporter periplasmic adaptor subunit [Pirellulales bacterium]